MCCLLVPGLTKYNAASATSVPEVLSHITPHFPKVGLAASGKREFCQDAAGERRVGWRSLEHEVRARGHGRQGTEKRIGNVTERNRLNAISVGRRLLVGNGTCLAKSNQSL